MRSVGFKSMLLCPGNLSKGLNHARNPKLLMLAAALQFWLTNYFLSVTKILQSSIFLKKLLSLGNHGHNVTWLAGDITTAQFPHHHFDVWHDRAVFHFLTDPKDRELYIKNVLHSVKPGGHVIVATFSLNGPAKCSGLEVVRYNPETLHGEFGENFDLIDHVEEKHKTPFGTEQQFIYCFCKK